MTDIDDSFKEQITIFYYAHMRRVAHNLFSQGLKTTTVAASLLLTKSKALRWRELFDKGHLLQYCVDQSAVNLTLPFAQASHQYHWEDFAYDVKRAAIVFFDMGLRCRAIAVYLGVPINKVSAWQRLHKNNEFKIEPPVKLPPLELTEDKLIVNSRNQKCYSHEVRAIAKQCFEKGMNTYEVARYLEIPKDTIYAWTCLYKKGRFYTNEEEKNHWDKSSNASKFVYSLSERCEAKACFIKGMTISETAKYLKIPRSTVLRWFSQFKENSFYTNAEEKKRFAKNIKRTRYSFEVKLTAKALFENGIDLKEIACSLGVPLQTVKHWNRKHEAGKFCIKDTRKEEYLKKLDDEAQASIGKRLRRSYTEETRLTAKACFDRGLSWLETAMILGIPKGTVKDWKRSYEEGHFKLKKKNRKTWI